MIKWILLTKLLALIHFKHVCCNNVLLYFCHIMNNSLRYYRIHNYSFNEIFYLQYKTEFAKSGHKIICLASQKQPNVPVNLSIKIKNCECYDTKQDYIPQR